MTNWPLSSKPKRKMTKNYGFSAAEYPGVFVILTAIDVIDR